MPRLSFSRALLLGCAVPFLLTACSTNYASKKECQRAENAYRGGVVGFLIGSSFGSGTGGVLAATGGTLAGRGLGVLANNEVNDKNEADDVRQYEGNWYGACSPTGYVKSNG